MLRGMAAALIVGVGLFTGQGGADTVPGQGDSSWLKSARQAIEDMEYRVTPQARSVVKGEPGGLHAANRAQDLRAYFRVDGMQLLPRAETNPGWQWHWRTEEFGREGRIERVEPVEPESFGKRVEYRLDGLKEWYENGELGIEQGFTLSEPPEGAGPVIVRGRISDDLDAVAQTDSGTVRFLDSHGAEMLRYSKLLAFDSDGVRLPAHIRVSGTSLSLVVDDTQAKYPVTIDPLLSRPAWTYEADQTGAALGVSVASGGDVNGDGFADVLVGAPLFDGGLFNEGAAFAFLGSATGLSAQPNWRAEGEVVNAQFGQAVACAGDVNGDGYDEVIVGGHTFNTGSAEVGRAWLYRGSSRGPSTTANWYSSGTRANAQYGFAVAGAGDVNGDGYDDVIVGAPRHTNDQTNEGRAYVYHGAKGGLSLTAASILEGNQAEAAFGCSVARVGDINDDGRDDVIIGAYLHDGGQPDEGRAYVYHGTSAGLGSAPAWTAEPDSANAWFGYSVSGAGDINRDGYDDVIVGARNYTNAQSNEGAAFAYLGSRTGLAATPAWTTESNKDQAHYGASVSGAGDVDGDGYHDVIVGAPQLTNGALQEGRVYAFHGSRLGLSTEPRWIRESDQTGASLGASVSCAGDVNGDGYDDVIVGAPGYDNGHADEGMAFVFYGAPPGLPAADGGVRESDSPVAAFGYSVSGAGDVNGDGYDDVIVGAPFYDGGLVGQGAAFVFHGSRGGMSSVPLWSATILQANARFGYSVSGAGDVNDDGYDDVIVGAPKYTDGEQREGRAFCYLGSATGLSRTANWGAESNRTGAEFATSVSGAGDVNGDGVGDVIVGAPFYDDGADEFVSEGRAFIYLGVRNFGLVPSASWSADTNFSHAQFGASVSDAGDVNFDGYDDVIVGAPNYSNIPGGEGAAFVFHGAEFLQSTTPAWTEESDLYAVAFGRSVSGAGDVNRDGYDDVIVGAPNDFQGEPGLGRVYVFRGSRYGVRSPAFWSRSLNQTGAKFGASVSGAGDVDADGYDDFLVGSPGFTSGQSGEGAAFLYMGNATALPSNPLWRAEANQSGAMLGNSVSDAGDINGDGFADVLVGAPGFDNGETDEGRAAAYMGPLEDDDGDGITNDVEGGLDPDRDGVPNWFDLDSDGDGIPDIEEGVADIDRDGTPNFLDLDSDADGIPDKTEILNGTNPYRAEDKPPLDTDINGDGVVDAVDVQLAVAVVLETDGAGVDADVNNDGKTNVLDIQLIINDILGIS